MTGILYAIALIFFIMWIAGFAVMHIGPLIHLLLVVAVVAIVFNLLTGRRIA